MVVVLVVNHFLNHLCDEEQFSPSVTTGTGFLNHLCDEEPAAGAVIANVKFLNHLCDEERSCRQIYL
ncbi:hypothetical protein J520_2478 [Acinetobacter sp. 869535]|nr:hypothetical protein J520_2478 [Acinetobacter sp. 869535]